MVDFITVVLKFWMVSPSLVGLHLWEFYVEQVEAGPQEVSWDQSLSWFLSLNIRTYRGAYKSDFHTLKAPAQAPCTDNLPYWPLKQANGIFLILLSYVALGGFWLLILKCVSEYYNDY